MIPAGATTGPVVVTTQAGTATSAFKETLEPCAAGPATEKPAVSSAPARARGGKPLEFIGSGFIGVTKVTANGSPAPYSIPTDQNMYVTVPKSVPNGKVTITLTSAAGNTKVTVQKVS